MMQFLDWLEHSPLSMWIKESESLWPYDIFCLSMHSVGMALFVGFSTAFALRGIGYAPRAPFGPLRRFLPVIYVGFWMAVVSGVGLFITYPVKAVRNPIFWIKMLGIVVAVISVRQITRSLFDGGLPADSLVVPAEARRASVRLLGAWTVSLTAGRMLAYEGIPSIEWRQGLGMAALVVLFIVIFRMLPRLHPASASATAAAAATDAAASAASALHSRTAVRG